MPEIQSCTFSDQRHKSRMHTILENLEKKHGSKTSETQKDWASTKGYYRFLSNQSITANDILSGHYCATADRVRASNTPVLVLHDTTTHTFNRVDEESIGWVKLHHNELMQHREEEPGLICGTLFHASLAVTAEGVPLGLLDAHFWSRENMKLKSEAEKRQKTARLPIEKKESYRWLEGLKNSEARVGEREYPLIHVADRESDIFAYFNEAEEQGAYFLSRVKMNRLADESSLFEVMVDENDKLQYDISLFDRNRKKINATIGVTAKRVLVHPPETAKDRYPSHNLMCICATEIDPPKGRKPISWSLLTNLPVKVPQDLKKVLEWYKLRWQVEYFFKILKMELNTESSKLRSFGTISNFLALSSILAWRIHWLVFLNRSKIEASPTIAFTATEIDILKRFSKKKLTTLQDFINALATHGGYLARRSDPPPGLIIISRALRRLKDIVIGYELAQKDVGN